MTQTVDHGRDGHTVVWYDVGKRVSNQVTGDRWDGYLKNGSSSQPGIETEQFGISELLSTADIDRTALRRPDEGSTEHLEYIDFRYRLNSMAHPRCDGLERK